MESPTKGQQAYVPLLLFNDIQELQNKMEALIDLENKKTEERLVSVATCSDITKNPSVLRFLKTHLKSPFSSVICLMLRIF